MHPPLGSDVFAPHQQQEGATAAAASAQLCWLQSLFFLHASWTTHNLSPFQHTAEFNLHFAETHFCVGQPLFVLGCQWELARNA
jgi:hypothetical protein